MSDEVKESMTPQEQEAEDVAAFLMLWRTGLNFNVDNIGEWTATIKNSWDAYVESGETLMDAVMKLASKMPDVFDLAKGE